MQSYSYSFVYTCLRIFSFFITINLVSGTAITLPENVNVSAIFGFGDSIIDPGNNNNINTIIKCNFSPYGQDFVGGVPSGRFSNGRIPIDFIAELFAVKQNVPAYLDSSTSPEDLLTGVSFASGGAGYDPLTTSTASVISLSEQLNYFKEYKGRVTQLVGEERLANILSNAVFFVVAGSNDIANTYFGPSTRRFHYDFEAYTNLMIDSASSFVQNLYKLGARKIAVFSAPPIGCVPSQRTIGGGFYRNCADAGNQVAQLFNSKLSGQLDFLANKFYDAKIVYVDIYNPLLDFIQNPQNYGFEQVRRGCCGTGLIEVSILCNKFDPVCEDNTKYLFWDSYHPTERGYELLSNSLVQKYVNKFF